MEFFQQLGLHQAAKFNAFLAKWRSREEKSQNFPIPVPFAGLTQSFPGEGKHPKAGMLGRYKAPAPTTTIYLLFFLFLSQLVAF